MVPTVFLRQSSYRRPRCHPADPARDVRLHNTVPCRVRRTASGATHSVVDGESNETGKSLRQRAAIIPRFSPGGFHRRPLLQNNRISLRHFRPLGVRFGPERPLGPTSGLTPIADSNRLNPSQKCHERTIGRLAAAVASNRGSILAARSRTGCRLLRLPAARNGSWQTGFLRHVEEARQRAALGQFSRHCLKLLPSPEPVGEFLLAKHGPVTHSSGAGARPNLYH